MNNKKILLNGNVEHSEFLPFPANLLNQANFGAYVFEDDVLQVARKYYSIDMSIQACAGYGATDIITQFLHPGLACVHNMKVAYVYPYFTEGLERLIHANGHQSVALYSESDYLSPQISFLEKTLKNCNGAFLIANPTNPTGQAIPSDELARMAKRFPNVFFLIDETFELYRPSCTLLRHLPQLNNVGLVKGFSKGEGYPGFRMGFLLTGNTELATKIKTLRVRYYSQADLILLEYLLRNRGNIRRNVNFRLREKTWMTRHLKQIGYKVIPTDTHFLLLELNNTSDVQLCMKYARKRGFDFSNFIDLFPIPSQRRYALDQFVRITPVDRQSNLLALDLLRSVSSRLV